MLFAVFCGKNSTKKLLKIIKRKEKERKRKLKGNKNGKFNIIFFVPK